MGDLRNAERQKLALLDTELGSETALAEQNNPLDRLKYGDLPADKARQAKAIDQDYEELLSRFVVGTLRITVPGDRENLARLAGEKEKDLMSVLNSTEYEAYLLRSSATADRLRSSLVTFRPTEEEFRRIFRLQRSFDEKYPLPWLADSAGVATVEEFAARQRDRTELTNNIKSSLGPERAAEYERESDYGFRQLSQAIVQAGIPKDAAIQAWNVQQEFNRRALELRANRNLRPADVTTQINGMRSELTERLYQALGGQLGLELYNRSTTGGAVRPLPTPTKP
jgi:hypothetical protein